MRNQEKMLSKMIAIVSANFNGVLDKGGKPYILHCLRVMDSVKHLGPEVMQIAVGHDLVEDTDVTLDYLKEQGFSDRVIEAIKLLTHDQAMSYDVYIKRLSFNDDAKAVKKADLRDNSNISRLKGLRQKDFERLEKYNRAYQYLSD